MATSKLSQDQSAWRVDMERHEKDENPTTLMKTSSSASRRKLACWMYAIITLFLLDKLYTVFVRANYQVATLGAKNTDVENDTSNICLSPACIHASSAILYNLSPDYQNIDPCTNFEELVCGGWRDRNDLRPDQGDAFTGTMMAETSQMLLRHILEAPYPKDSSHSHFSPAQLRGAAESVDEKNFNKLKDAYDACLDEQSIRAVGTEPLVRALNETSSNFHNEADDQDVLPNTILHLSKLGINALVAIGTGADDKDPDSVVVSVSAPYRIGLPAKELYEDPKILAKYEKVASQVFQALYPSSSQDSDLYHNLVEFEKRIAAATPDAEDRDDVEQYYNPISLTDADKLVPQIQLAKLIKGLAGTDQVPNRIIMMAPKYMKNLTSILSDTPKQVVQTHLLWRQIQTFSSYIEADAVTPLKQLTNELQGKDPDSAPERWRTCVAHVDDGLGWFLSRFFVEKAFSAKAKSFGDQIVSDIKDQFVEKLKVTEWMEESVIDLAIRKVHNIVQKIGYPDKSPNILDPEALSKFYSQVNISQSTYFDNAISMSKSDITKEWSALGKPVDRNEWDMTVPTVNAYYNPPGNEIVFPAGIMQFPVFDVNVPQYLSYGAFGSVSGHELSHAFDSTGRHYDQNGNYTDWWTDNTVKAFQQRAQCFVEQYANFTVDGPDNKPLHVNGKLTLGENIADAGGVAAAFKAWKKRAAQTPNQDLPGLEFFTQEQLFFVSYSNWWCGKSRRETAINRVYTDPHAPKWARVLGTMANSRDFRESFECKVKEPVCELW